MKKYKTIEEYFNNAQNRKEILFILRDILLTTELEETLKWGSPVYAFQGKNIVGLGSFKSYVGLWFFQGALLKDKAKVLINAQEDVTKALRQWRFTSLEKIEPKLILDYVNEAIQNQKQGLEIKPERNKTITIPIELKIALQQNKQLESSYKQFTLGKQREFAAYISSAKRKETRRTRIKKITPLILQNIGLNDKY